jgi:anaerobic carbon-monoxide dehydrogenase iron sulfur subunit
MVKTMNPKNEKQDKPANLTRRDFIWKMAVGGGAAILFGRVGDRLLLASVNTEQIHEYLMIQVDYSKCTGCRTCESVCSSFNHRQVLNGESLLGLGNPLYSNIRVRSYNPDLNIPAVCALCPDAPCIRSCPVKPDLKTERKALYRDKKAGTIRNDPDRCIGCGSCQEACKIQRIDVIVLGPKRRPERICTLCDGDPQCVKYCPFNALSFAKLVPEREFYGLHPDIISKKLINRWYNIEG